MKDMLRKINLYVLSLGLLFLFIIIITFQLPSKDVDLYSFEGWASFMASNYVSLFSLSMIIYCVFAYLWFDNELKGATQIPFAVTKIENVDYEHLTFLATYVVPLISFDFGSGRQLIVLALLMVAMGVIYIKTNLFYANPSLALIGFRIYRVDGSFKTGERQGIIIICRRKLAEGDKATYIKLDDNIYFAKKVTG